MKIKNFGGDNKMRYSKGFKISVLKKILPPSDRSIREVAKETGVSENTLYIWLKKLGDGKMDNDDSELRPADRNPKEKLRLLLEGKSLKPEEQGEWLRENGLHSEHLNLYEQELREMVSDQNQKYKDEIKALKKDKRTLEKELHRKEKALAEMAALLTLKKKASEIWGENEDD
jgi:transposase